MLLKIQYENLLPKGGGSDQPSLAHKVFIHHIINGEKVNMPKYIFKHMIKELRESQMKDKAWNPYGRLIYEIFHQGGIIQALNETRFYIDDKLEIVIGKVINGKTLKNMQLVKKFTPLNSDISESMVVSDLMENFPPICKKDSLALQMALLSDHYANTGEIIGLDEVPEDMPGSKLPVEKGRKAKRKEMTQEEYLKAEKPSKRVKKDKAFEKLKSSAYEVPSIQKEAQDLNPEAIIPKKTRSGTTAVPASSKAPGQTLLKKKKRTPEPMKLKESVYVTEEIDGMEKEEERPSKRQSGVEIVSPMFVMTPEIAKRCKEHGDKIMAEKKRKAAQYKLDRDEQLKAIGQENCDKFYVKKIAEVQEIANRVEEEAVKTSEATATELVTREVRKKKMVDADALQKVLEIAKEIEILASMLSKDGVAEVAEQALKSATELKMNVTAEAENLLLAHGVKGVQMVSTTRS